MRFRSPVSRGSFSLRFSAFDFGWALVCPGLVLWIRGAQALLAPEATDVAVFWAISTCATLFSVLVFRIRDGLTHLFSVHDAIDVGKTVALTELLTAFVMVTAARLNGIPRSILILHGLFLLVGFVGMRVAVRMMSHEGAPRIQTTAIEHVLFLGANKLTALYIEILRTYAPGRYEVVGVLDDAPSMIGRSVAGTRVLGRTGHLVPLVQELKEHGVFVSQVLVGGDADALTDDEREEIEEACQEFELQLGFIPTLLGLSDLRPMQMERSAQRSAALSEIGSPPMAYTRAKRAIDVVASVALIICAAPIAPAVALLVLLDVGSPVLFWQRRTGLNGRSFHLYKFRTLKSTFDHSGTPIADSRMSWAGQLLRRFRLDELPQLLNVVIGDMSLIGPRPLLPKDQPSDSTVRLSVRPGITGWAQVNGGTLLSPEEKNALDEWYVSNMSFWTDVKIVCRTIAVVFGGERIGSDAAIARATTAPVKAAANDDLRVAVNS